MKLINKTTGKEVTIGSLIYDNDGVECVITYMPPPHKPSSEGKMQVRYIGEHEPGYILYCSVFNCEWIDREDRIEQSMWLPAAMPEVAAHWPKESQPPQVGGITSKTLPSVNTPDTTKLIEALTNLVEAANKVHKQLSGYGGFNAELDDALDLAENTLKEVQS